MRAGWDQWSANDVRRILDGILEEARGNGAVAKVRKEIWSAAGEYRFVLQQRQQRGKDVLISFGNEFHAGDCTQIERAANRAAILDWQFGDLEDASENIAGDDVTILIRDGHQQVITTFRNDIYLEQHGDSQQIQSILEPQRKLDMLDKRWKKAGGDLVRMPFVPRKAKLSR